MKLHKAISSQDLANKDQRRFQEAVAFHQRGNVDEAEKHYLSLLKRNPCFAQAWHLLGVLRFHQNDFVKADQFIEKAISLNNRNADYFRDFAMVQKSMGNVSNAISALQEAVKLNPNALPIWLELSALRFQIGQLEQSLIALQNAQELAPDNNDISNRMARCYFELGDMENASVIYSASVRSNPKDYVALNNHASILRLMGKVEAGLQELQNASRQNPEELGLLWYLADYLNKIQRHSEAEPLLRIILQQQPRNIPAISQLCITLEKLGHYSDAISYAKQAEEIEPTNTYVLSLLGNLFMKCGQIEKAHAYFEQVIEREPQNSGAYSNLLFNLNYRSDISLRDSFKKHKEAAIAARVKPSIIHQKSFPTISKSPPLVVGYISPDFHNHSVAYFFDALIRGHDRNRVKIICYSDSTTRDRMNANLRNLADKWYDIAGKSDTAVSRIIAKDSPDILVELAGRTANNRLSLLSTRQAPIQISYLGYPNTTGLSSIDYRFTDAVADPDGYADAYHTEKLWRLKGGFLCYSPAIDSPDVYELPAKKKGFITFGSFNNRAKINAKTLGLWADVLDAVPDSQLLIKCGIFSDDGQRQQFTSECVAAGMDPGRLQLLCHTSSTQSHLAIYHQVDIALDTVPYNGTTTTCEALWMGVPVITLTQECHASRVGASILTQINQTALVAHDDSSFVEISRSLANDIDRLAKMRESLRSLMRQSPLMDARRLANEIELAYEIMWRQRNDDTELIEPDNLGTKEELYPTADDTIHQPGHVTNLSN